MRRLVIIILVAIVVVVGGALIALSFINVDQYRPRIQAELQKKLGRQVTLGKLDLKIFPLSIQIDGVTIGESPAFQSSQPFATASKVSASASLLSLITGNPQIKSVSLAQPKIQLIRNAQGQWNYSTLGGNTPSNAQAAPKTETDASKGGSNLSLSDLKITDGQITYRDDVAKTPASTYDHIDLHVTDFSPNKKFGIDAALHFPGEGKQLASFEGNVGPIPSGSAAATPVDGKLSLSEVSLEGVNRFAAGTIPPNTNTVASGEAKITSENEVISAKGDLKLANTVVHGNKIDYPINAEYNLRTDRKSNITNIQSANIKLGDTPFTISGDINSSATPTNLNVHVTTQNASLTEMARLAGALGVAFNPDYQVKGNLTADLTAKGPQNAPQLSGSLSAKNINVAGGEIKEPVSVPEVSLNLTPELVKSNTFTAKSGSTSIDAGFALANYMNKNSNVDASLKTDGANLAELLNIAKAYGLSDTKGMSATGKLSLNVHVKGPTAVPAKLVYAGNGNLSGATITTPELTKPVSISSANMQFSQNSVGINGLAAAVGSTNLKGNLSAKDFSAPQVQFALSADKINTTELQQLVAKPAAGGNTPAPASQPAAKKPAPSAATDNQPDILDRTTGGGTLSAGTVVAEGFTLTNVRTTCKLNKGIIDLAPLTADIFNGKENGTISLNTRPKTPTVNAKLKFAGVDTNQLLSAVSSAKNTLYGSLGADTNMAFALASSNELAQSLNGSLKFDVTNGELKNVNILNELAKVGKFLGQPATKGGNSTAIKQFSGSMNVVNGVGTTDDLKAALDAASVSAAGNVNLVNQGVNMHATAVLPSGASQAAGGTKIGGYMNTALANNNGELVIPVLVTGSLSSLHFAPDVASMAKLKVSSMLPTAGNPGQLTSGVLGSVLGKKGGGAAGAINGILNGGKANQGDNGQAPAGQQPGAQPGNQQDQNPVDQLKGIFGKKKKKPQ